MSQHRGLPIPVTSGYDCGRESPTPELTGSSYHQVPVGYSGQGRESREGDLWHDTSHRHLLLYSSDLDKGSPSPRPCGHLPPLARRLLWVSQ